jgi:hypothetical protein
MAEISVFRGKLHALLAARDELDVWRRAATGLTCIWKYEVSPTPTFVKGGFIEFLTCCNEYMIPTEYLRAWLHDDPSPASVNLGSREWLALESISRSFVV